MELRRKIKDFFYGFAILPHLKTLAKLKFQEDVFLMTVSIGDMLGLPIMPPMYRLNLLPYWLPLIKNWKRHILAERGSIEKIAE